MDMQNLRAAAVAKLAGRSPREVGRLKDLTALRWVYRWGWSSAQVIDSHASPGRRGVAARLVDKGLLEAHETEGAGGIKGVPLQVLTLTQDGVTEVETDLSENELLGYPIKGEDTVIWRQLRHDLLIQRYTAIRLNEKKIASYSTPREISNKSMANVKQPDAIWKFPDGNSIAIELELTAKKDRELDQFILGVLSLIHPNKGIYNSCAILSHSKGLLDRYKRNFKVGSTVKKYKRDASRHWVTDGEFKVPEYAQDNVLFIQVAL